MGSFLIILLTIALILFAYGLRRLRSHLLANQSANQAAIEKGILLSIKVPKFNEQGPIAASMMFSALHGLLHQEEKQQIHLSLEIVAESSGIRFFVFTPEKHEKFVRSQVYAQYPNAEINKVEDYASLVNPNQMSLAATELTLVKPFFFPIKTFPDFEVDPLAAITSAVEGLGEGSQAWLQILIKPLPDVWQQVGYDYVNLVRSGGPLPAENLVLSILKDVAGHFISLIPQMIGSVVSPTVSTLPPGAEEQAGKPAAPVRLSAGQDVALKAIEKKLGMLGFETVMRVVGVAPSQEEAIRNVDDMVASLKQFSTADLNSLERSSEVKPAHEVLLSFIERGYPTQESNLFVLSTEELASIYHLPNVSVETPNIAWTRAKKAEYPLDLPVRVEPIIAETAFRDEHVQFGIRRDDRRRHMYIIGKTGSGKSTLQENMIISDIEQDEGVCVIDPHGELIEHVLEAIPDHRVEDVIIFDPSDLNFPVALNMLEMFEPDQMSLMASGLIDVFKKRFEFSWGPRMEHLLRNCILTLLDVPGTTLLGITRLLMDKGYRNYMVHLITDPVIKEFWEREYKEMTGNVRLVTEAISPIQNRLGQFLASPMIRNIVGQAKSTIRLDEIMNQRKVLLINLAKGKIGEDNMAILGGMMMSRLWFAAMTRVRIPEEERPDFFVYVDEFQNFATSSFAAILSEARKYRLSLCLAHQYIDQLPEEIRNAVFGNVGTLISFNLGPKDAMVIANEFEPVFDANDLIGLEKWHIYLKMMIDVTQTRPFSARTLPPIRLKKATDNEERVMELSRQKYGTDRSVVEDRVQRWAEKQFTPGMDEKVVKDLKEKMRQQALKGDLGTLNELGDENRSALHLPTAIPRTAFRLKDRRPTPVTLKGEIRVGEEE